MVKYCPIMSRQNKWNIDIECHGKECAWADKNGNCLVVKALKQYTDPLSTLAQGYPANQKIIEVVHKDSRGETFGYIYRDEEETALKYLRDYPPAYILYIHIP